MRDKIWNKVKRFEGETISVSDSVKELGINPDLIYSCIEKGYIRAIDPPSKGGRSRTRRLNKADVAYVAALSKHGGGRGHRLFTPDTIPPHAVVPNAVASAST